LEGARGGCEGIFDDDVSELGEWLKSGGLVIV
jgi:hypothetical protein